MVVLLLTRIQPPAPCLQALSHIHHQQICPQTITLTSFSINNHQTHRRIHTKSRRWDSNAETFRTRNYDFEDDDFEDVDEVDTNQWLDILEDFIDGVWIFKAFRSFGWMLPAIISSLLLTSGPKAFLMALAIPIGQSALSMLFQTVWGRPKNRTKCRGKSKRKQPSPPRATSYVDTEDEHVKEEKKRATAYQTWVAGDGGSSDKKNSGASSSFGGWEDLDGKSKPTRDRKRKTKNKMSRRKGRNETPLLLRLLIAVFPFLGSWTRML